MSHLRLGFALMVLMLAPIAAARAGAAPCPPGSEDDLQGHGLPHLAAALTPHGQLNILALELGPATHPHGGPSGLARQAALALQAARPGLQTSVVEIDGAGMLAPDQLRLILAGLRAHPAQLVLWQTGTREAVNDEPSDDFYQALSDGAGAITALGADLVLIEPQYSRFLDANATLAPYLSAMETVSTLPGVMLFHRYELMHDWVDAGAIDLEEAAPSDRPHVAARLHACLGMALARALVSGVE